MSNVDWLYDKPSTRRRVRPFSSKEGFESFLNEDKGTTAKVVVDDRKLPALIAIICLLVIGLIATYAFKLKETQFRDQLISNNQNFSKNTSEFDYENYSGEYDGVTKSSITRIEFDNLVSIVDRIWGNVKNQKELQIVTNFVNVHNLAVLHYGYNKDEIIYFNKDWTIDRIPNRISLNESQRQLLSKYLKSSR